MPAKSKQSLRASARIFLVGLFGSLILRLLHRSLRWSSVDLSGDMRTWAAGKPCIIAFWHAQQLLMPWIYLGCSAGKMNPIHVLISEHEDGRMIARVIKFLGLDSVAGSSTNGGKKALFKLIKKIREGSHIAITPDGPKGPRCQMHDGIIRLAQRSSAPIYPAAIASQKKWKFRSWDQMFLPKPFSRAVIILGKPISIPMELDKEQAARYSKEVENTLNSLTLRAEEYSYQ